MSAIDDVAETSGGLALLLALFALTDRQRYVVVQRHLCGRLLDDIAAELGITRQGASITEQKALTNLRRGLTDVRHELAA